MINLELTPKIKEWLETEPAQRDLRAGAELLLRVTRNQVLFKNVSQNIQAKGKLIEYHLNKIYVQRLADITHEQVKEMMVKVDAIDRARGLSKPVGTSARSELQRGKRADHNELPAEIQQLYVDNGDIMRRMRDLHTKLRLISPENSTCPDSDRYPIAQRLIELDGTYRDNWNRYDHYIKGTPVASVQLASDDRTAQANAARYCNLLLGKYAKSPTDELAERIKQTYASVNSPTINLTEKMKTAKLI